LTWKDFSIGPSSSHSYPQRRFVARARHQQLGGTGTDAAGMFDGALSEIEELGRAHRRRDVTGDRQPFSLCLDNDREVRLAREAVCTP